ncbi:MAG: glycosyltransferase [Chthoniobacteraceae bacterium]|jgi:glycosyltransferase involved in cell wall biosynthesis
MDISVIICTYNRADSLRMTLQCCVVLRIPAGVTWELLVVDNNSTDHTARVCEEYAGKLPLRRIEEKRQGLSMARNRGIKEARGEIVTFTDDDVDVDPDWLAGLSRAATAHPEAAFFGGKVAPIWKEKPAAWMAGHSRDLLAGVTMDLDLGAAEMPLGRKQLPFGANMAFRREAFLKMGSFREDLGMTGRLFGVHEEIEFMTRLIEAGCIGFYVPGMVVGHRNPPERMTERYMLGWCVGCGRCDVRTGHIHPTDVTLFNAPRYLWRQLLSNAASYLAKRWRPSADAAWLPPAISMAKTWGAIMEFRRMHAEARRSGPASRGATR